MTAVLIGGVAASAQNSPGEGVLARAKPSAPRTPIMLRPNSSHPISVLPFSYYGEPLCDAEGNLYFHRDNGVPNTINVLRISPTGEEDGGVRMDGELAAKYMFVSFAVAPSGSIHVLADDGEKPAVISFGGDGQVRDKTELDVPADVALMTFAVFNHGSIIASGAYNGLGKAATRGKRYTAIFEPSGKLRMQLKMTAAAKRSDYPIRLNEGGIAIGRDDNAYILDGSRILVISEYGETVRRINYGSKLTGEIGARLNISGGLLVVALNSPGEAMIDRRYLVLDAETGEDLGLYSAGIELQNQDVCFSERDGFTFLVVDKSGKLSRVTAPLR